jgi:hypothetical protein
VSQQKETTEIKVPVECYSRVVGIFRPVSHWHTGKQEEFRQRIETNPADLPHMIDKDIERKGY